MILRSTDTADALSLDDDLVFDQNIFAQSLCKQPALKAFKAALAHGTRVLDDAFVADFNIRTLIHKRAWLIDQILLAAWQRMINNDDLALVAVGGYGRGELHPASDIDLMILGKTNSLKKAQRQIETFLAFLWDLGLEVGHSVRSVKMCVRESQADITVATNLMESRLLFGSIQLFAAMQNATGPHKLWSTKKFFQAKRQEQIERHGKYANTEHNLEPNIKEGPGGLRDIQMIGWVARRHFNVSDLHGLVAHAFLTEEEYQILSSGQDFLWRVRYALHYRSGIRNDRLSFDHQRQIAKIFGFHAKENRGVEQFMKFYYRTVRDLSRLNEILLQHFQEAIIYAKRREKIRPINKRFQIRNDYLEVCHDHVFRDYPFALLELFLIKQQILSIKGIRASTIRLVRQYLHLINDDFRNDVRNRSLFMEIIRQPRLVGHELRRMHRYGVLSSYLPAFARIEGQMQFDLFHAYTVDEHILFVVRNMRYFGLPEYADTYPHCQTLLKAIPKQELLYLAGLFHDIAKGRNGDHSKLGFDDAVHFCRQHGLSDYDTRLVGWLVENHLILSKTAQREDINDPDVINRFALKVGDRQRLDYLYLLTVADVSGTNPVLWNHWKDTLFRQLYYETTRALRRGLENPEHKEERISDTKAAALQLVGKRTRKQLALEQFWASLGEDYFIRYSADEIAWHAKSIANHLKQPTPLITLRQQTVRGGTELFVYMKNRDHIFAVTTQVLDRIGLTIVDARVLVSIHGFTLDTYIILNQAGEAITDRQQQEEVINQLMRALTHIDRHFKKMPRRKSKEQSIFPVPTTIRFSQDEKNRRTIMEVIATDRPGFLSCVGFALGGCKTRIHVAKISTYGSRVEDIFFITDREDNPITDTDKLREIKYFITETLA